MRSLILSSYSFVVRSSISKHFASSCLNESYMYIHQRLDLKLSKETIQFHSAVVDIHIIAIVQTDIVPCGLDIYRI